MTYTYDDDLCFSAANSPVSTIQKDAIVIKNRINQIINDTFAKTTAQTKYYKLLHKIDIDAEIKPLTQLADNLRQNFSDVVIISMGGASLNPQAIVALKLLNSQPRFHFLNSTDPRRLIKIFSEIDLAHTACIVISNSGSTTETISMFGVLLNAYQQAKLPNIPEHFYFITGSGDTPLRSMASNLGSTILDHSNDICGRYSGFSNVGILPGLIAGLDMRAFLEGANSVLDDLWSNKENSLPAKSATTLNALNLPITVNISYMENLFPFLEWQRQIISESLGKNGNGITPLHGIGPMEQHSILQLYLDGPKDKLFTFFYAKESPENSKELSISADTLPAYLKGKYIGEINNAELNATIGSLADKKLPVRTIIIDEFNEFALGALMMHSAIETVILGHLMSVNPFDQPGVEQIKIKAKKILGK